MKTNLLVAVLFSISASFLFAQPTFEWAQSGGTSNLDDCADVAFDGLGNNYSVYNRYTASFQPSMWLVKRTNTGGSLWTKTFSNGIRIQGAKLVTDATGNLYVAGKYEGTADFDPGAGTFNMTSNGNDDYFVAKYDPNGNFIWAKGFGSADDEEVRGIQLDNIGNVVVIGRYMNTVDFDPSGATMNLTVSGSRDIFIQKLTSNGDLVWAKSVGGTGFDSGHTLTIDQNNNIIASGGYQGTADFDPGVGVSNHTSNGSFDIFILKLTPLGDYVWSKSIGGTSNDIAFRMVSSSTGNIYITGTFLGTVDFDPSGVVNNMNSLGSPYDCFVLKLDGSGNYIWSEHFGSATGHGAGYGISLDANENVYVTGTYDETVDFDPGVGVAYLYAPDEDYYVLKLSSAGAYHWAVGSGGTVPGAGNAVEVDANDNVLVAGAFYGTRDFDPGAGTYNLSSNGGYDYFTWMLSQCSSTTVTPDLASLPNITNQCEVSSLTAPTATNSCSQVITATHATTLPITSQGTTTVTWTYDDGNGNTLTQSQDVVITDNTAPVADNNSLPDVTAECSVASITPPSATDNCSAAVTVTNNASFPITSQGTTVITWTYDDGNGNTATQSQNVVITDAVVPIADLANLPDITSECEVTPTEPTATDNCSGSLNGSADLTFPITSSGTTVVTWTYDDGNGNTTSQTQNVIITPIDNTITQIDATTWGADASGYTYQWVDCDNANAPVSGATNQTFSPSVGGNYACEVSNGTCAVISSCFSSSVGINENGTIAGSAYPNPAQDNVTIALETTEDATLIVTDLSGKTVISKLLSFANGNVTVNIANLQSGLYLFNITLENGLTSSFNIVKN